MIAEKRHLIIIVPYSNCTGDNMNELVRAVNAFFRNAPASEVKSLREKLILGERQSEVFDRFYVRKQTVDFIADSLCVGPKAIKNDLRSIRHKIAATVCTEIPR